MDIARVIQYVLIGALVVAALLKTGDTLRASGPRRASQILSGLLAAAFWLLAVGQVVSLPSISNAVDDLTGTGVTKVIYNGATVLGLAAVLAFFHHSSQAGKKARRRSVAESLAAIIVVALLSGFMTLTPAPLRDHSILEPGEGHVLVVAFYVLGNVWFIWAYLRGAAGATSFARASGGALAAASGLIAIGLLAGGLTAAMRLGIISFEIANSSTDHALVLNEINFAVNNVGLLLDTVGLCVLGVLRLVEARRRRRLYRQLAPLWRRLNAAFPEVRMPLYPGQGTGHDGLLARTGGTPAGPGEHRQAVLQPVVADYYSASYERRLVEIWDGLSRLCQPLNAKVAGRGPSAVTPDELAEAIADATAVRPPLGSDAVEAPSPELLTVLSGGESDRGLETGAEFLAMVSQALNDRVSTSGS